MPTPLNHVKIREFHDVTALGPDDVWAVGTEIRLRTGVIHPLTEHWDGTSWSLVNAPDGGAARGELKGVAAGSSGNVWAVGYREVSGHSEPLVMRWDGTRWHVLAAPPGDALNDVTPRRSGTIWTVGSNPFGINHALLARRLDSGWVTSDVPPRVLKAMAWYRASDGWAVGYKPGPHSAPLQPLVVHWDGSSWIESPTPELHRSAELRGVAAISSHQVWAVGTRNYLHPLLMHWTGSEWRVAFKPLVNGILNDVARVPHMHELWAVGSSSPNPLIMRYC